MPPLSWASTAVILLSIIITLLLLRNNCIPLHQSSNFIQLLSNYPRSSIIFFGITACAISLCTVSISTVDISFNADFIILFLFEISSLVILNNPNISSSTLIPVASWLYLSVLSVCGFYYNSLYLSCLFLSMVSTTISSCCYSSNSLTVCLWFYYKFCFNISSVA